MNTWLQTLLKWTRRKSDLTAFPGDVAAVIKALEQGEVSKVDRPLADMTIVTGNSRKLHNGKCDTEVS